MQRHLAEMPTAHGPAWIAPIHVDRLRSWCARIGNDPASGSGRSRYAAELARTASADLIAWPPLATNRAGAAAAQVQAVLRTPERRGDTCGAVMAGTCCRFASSSSKAVPTASGHARAGSDAQT